jgi:hypothetical protein
MDPQGIPQPDGYAVDPQLEMLWTAPPTFDGTTLPATGKQTAPGQQSRTNVPTTPPSAPFTVSLASLQSGQQEMLAATSAIVDAYNPLEAQVQNVIFSPGFFGQMAEVPGYKAVEGTPLPVPTNPFATDAQEFAESMNPTMTRALRSVADAMAAVGAFIGMINISGQAYTSADLNSGVITQGANVSTAPTPDSPASEPGP